MGGTKKITFTLSLPPSDSPPCRPPLTISTDRRLPTAVPRPLVPHTISRPYRFLPGWGTGGWVRYHGGGGGGAGQQRDGGTGVDGPVRVARNKEKRLSKTGKKEKKLEGERLDCIRNALFALAPLIPRFASRRPHLTLSSCYAHTNCFSHHLFIITFFSLCAALPKRPSKMTTEMRSEDRKV